MLFSVQLLYMFVKHMHTSWIFVFCYCKWVQIDFVLVESLSVKSISGSMGIHNLFLIVKKNITSNLVTK